MADICICQGAAVFQQYRIVLDQVVVKLSYKAGEKTPEGVIINIKLTKQDIAEMVGTTVETSIRTMSKLSKAGIISSKAGRIVIINLEKLKSLG